MPGLLVLLICFCWALLGSPALLAAPIEVTDSSGRMIRLERPAERIVVLAPSLVENLFAVGAGARIVGRVSHSDYPPAALKIPLIGDFAGFSNEAILALQPDLVLAWEEGNPALKVRQLESLGLNVARFSARTLEQLGDSFQLLGQLTGQAEQGAQVTQTFARRLQILRARAANLPAQPPRLFYQLWDDPLLTVNRSQLIDQAIRLCGAHNPFADLPESIPQLNLEAVLAAAPDIIVSTDEARPDWEVRWQHWRAIPAVANGALYTLEADQMHRPTLRFLDGVEALCGLVAQHRYAARDSAVRESAAHN